MIALLAEVEMVGLQRVLTDSISARYIYCADETFGGDVQESMQKYGSIFRREDQAGDKDVEIIRGGQ